MKELVLKKCEKCGATVEVHEECKCENCGIKCCGEQMQRVQENAVDCAVEKHMPVATLVGNYVVVSVNHVMEQEHYIEWIAIEGEGVSAKKYFKANELPKAVFPYIKGSKVYSYCNKHGLWVARVD